MQRLVDGGREDIALSLLSGQGYQRAHLGVTHYSQGPPFFAFFAAGVYALTSHSQTALVVGQIVLSSLVPVVIYRIGRLLGFSRPVAAPAGTVPVIHPGLIVYAVKKLHPLSCDALLIALAVLVALKLTDPPCGRSASVEPRSAWPSCPDRRSRCSGSLPPDRSWRVDPDEAGAGSCFGSGASFSALRSWYRRG